MSKELPKEAYYSIMGFLAPIIIECIDNLEGTTQYRHALKNRLKTIQKECEDIHSEIYNRFAKIDKQELQNLKEGDVPMLDIFNTISKSYDKAFEFFTTTPTNDMPILMDILQKAKEMDLSKYSMQITPIQRDYENH